MDCDYLKDERYCGHPDIGMKNSNEHYLCSHVRFYIGCPCGHVRSNTTHNKGQKRRLQTAIMVGKANKGKMKQGKKIMENQMKVMAKAERRAEREKLKQLNATHKGPVNAGSPDAQDNNRGREIIKADAHKHNSDSKSTNKKFKDEQKGKRGFR